jgi:hypothetical protein
MKITYSKHSEEISNAVAFILTIALAMGLGLIAMALK